MCNEKEKDVYKKLSRRRMFSRSLDMVAAGSKSVLDLPFLLELIPIEISMTGVVASRGRLRGAAASGTTVFPRRFRK